MRCCVCESVFFFQHEICTYIRRFFHVVKVDHSIFKGKSFIASNATAETVHKICGRSACFHTYFTFVYILHYVFFRRFYFSWNPQSNHWRTHFTIENHILAQLSTKAHPFSVYSHFLVCTNAKCVATRVAYLHEWSCVISLQKKIQMQYWLYCISSLHIFHFRHKMNGLCLHAACYSCSTYRSFAYGRSFCWLLGISMT